MLLSNRTLPSDDTKRAHYIFTFFLFREELIPQQTRLIDSKVTFQTADYIYLWFSKKKKTTTVFCQEPLYQSSIKAFPASQKMKKKKKPEKERMQRLSANFRPHAAKDLGLCRINEQHCGGMIGFVFDLVQNRVTVNLLRQEFQLGSS